ncbi:B-cell lymphoma 3 protein [Phlyctochytrium bullatum]|nr:B-cell lymphoma 3 protein [Phlyctochytrium bullatum]
MRRRRLAPAQRVPTLGQSTFPNELLRGVLLHVRPKDLLTLSAANRHLRIAVAACIDHDLAKHQIARTKVEESYGDDTEPHEGFLDEIPFNHVLLRFHHTAAAFLHHGVQMDVAYNVWGPDWRSLEALSATEALRADRVRALRIAVQSASWLVTPDETELDIMQMYMGDATEMAGLLKSMELLEDLRRVLPVEAGMADVGSECMERFLTASARVGFCQGLSLIPIHHPILFRFGPNKDVLNHAILSNHPPAVQLLLEKGCKPSRLNLSSYVQNHFRHGDEDASCKILQLLLKEGLPASRSLGHAFGQFSAIQESKKLTAAAACGHIHSKTLKLFLKHGANPNTRDRYGSNSSALHYCALIKNETRACIKLLLDARADMDAVNNDGYTPLALACTVNNEEAVRILLERGADTDIQSYWPPLHTAVFEDAPNLVTLLLDAGASVNFVDSNGKTPLHIALEEGKHEIAMMLLDAGADPNMEYARAFPVDDDANMRDQPQSGETAWQQLCSGALRNRRLLQWVLTQGGFASNKIQEYLQMRDWLFSNIEGVPQAPVPDVASTLNSRAGKRQRR